MNISVRDLWFAYPAGPEALRGVSFEIQSGQRTAIVGQNGSGKTTLAKHFNRLLRPTRGAVEVGGWDTREHTVAQMARRVGFLFQNPDEQIFNRRVEDEIAFGLRAQGLDRNEVERRVEAALALVELEEYRGTHPYELLPSQRKWVALASILAAETPVLMLDEPTTGQDASGLARMGVLIDRLAREGRTVVAITHDMDWCAEHFDRVIVMKQGQVLLDGRPNEVFGQADRLQATFVEPPQIARLGAALGIQPTVVTVDEFLQAWRRELGSHE